MNLREAILAEHSKNQKDKIVKWIGHSQKRFDELVSLFLHGEAVIMQRAAYPLSYCAQQYPSLVTKHFGKLLKNLSKKNLHDAVKRNTVRILEMVEIPERYHGQVMNLCFDYIQSPEESAAVKAFSLTVLEKLSVLYPDIKPELKTIIEDRWDFETAAFHSRGRKILKNL
jgi:hypothetical protein